MATEGDIHTQGEKQTDQQIGNRQMETDIGKDCADSQRHAQRVTDTHREKNRLTNR